LREADAIPQFNKPIFPIIDQSWPGLFPKQLGDRLQELLDNPED
jgi:hypothetical protein